MYNNEHNNINIAFIPFNLMHFLYILYFSIASLNGIILT